MFARIRTARPELESQHRHSHGSAGQRDRRQHARRALFAGCDGRRCVAGADIARKRRFHAGVGIGIPGLRIVVFSLHRHDRGCPQRSGARLGAGVDGLQYSRGMVRGLDRLSYRLVVVNELAGYSGCARRRRTGVVSSSGGSFAAGGETPRAVAPPANAIARLHDLKSSDKKGRS